MNQYNKEFHMWANKIDLDMIPASHWLLIEKTRRNDCYKRVNNLIYEDNLTIEQAINIVRNTIKNDYDFHQYIEIDRIEKNKELK